MVNEASGHKDELKENLVDVLGAPPEERAELLARMCGDDGKLLSELEMLIKAEDITQVLDYSLPTRSDEDLTLPAFPEPELGEDPLIGSHVGSYRLERCIGEGGMGRVYRAVQDDRELERKVAVKLIKTGMSSELLIQRFRQERQALAVQTHPNIARLFEGGTTEDNLPYFVMEYIEGLPIDRYCDQHRFTIKHRLALFQKVCAAVSSAHSHLIIHRDLKPSNILVNEEGEPKLLDFGIAKPLDHDLIQGEALETAPNSCFLTPEYASPEQILGQPVSTASDIYSLGVLLYELLVGRLPFRQKALPQEWARIVTETRPARPSTVAGLDDGLRESTARRRGTSPEKLGKILRGELDNIVLMAMKREPKRRYATVQQLAEDIDRCLRGLPIIAQADTLAYRARKFIGRHRMAVVGVILVMSSLVTAVIGVSLQARRAQAEAEKARAVVTFLKEMIISADPFAADNRDITVAETLDYAAGSIERRFRDQPGIAAEIHSAVGMSYMSLGNYAASETQLRQALDLRMKIHDSPHFELAAGLKHLGVAHLYLGHYEKGASLLSRSIAMFEKLGQDRPSYSNALNEFGMVCQEQGKHEQASDYFSRALAMARRLHGPNHENVPSITGNLAMSAHYRGNLEQAESMYREALDQQKKIHGEDHPDTAYTLGNLALVLIDSKDYDGGELLLNQSLALKRKFLGESHATVGLGYHNLAGVCLRSKAYDRAAAYLEKALAVYSRAYPEDHSRVAQSLLLKGNIHNVQQQYKAAEKVIRRALAIFKKSFSSDHTLIAYCVFGLGESLIGQGRYEEAEPFFLESYTSLRNKPGERNNLQRTIRGLVNLYELCSREEEATKFRAMLSPE